MLYATQPSTGTNAPKMRMRASRPAFCISSVAASASSGIPASAAADKPRPRGIPFLPLAFFSCMELNWFSPGVKMLYRTQPIAGPRIPRKMRARLSKPATWDRDSLAALACSVPNARAPASVSAAVCDVEGTGVVHVSSRREETSIARGEDARVRLPLFSSRADRISFPREFRARQPRAIVPRARPRTARDARSRSIRFDEVVQNVDDALRAIHRARRRRARVEPGRSNRIARRLRWLVTHLAELKVVGLRLGRGGRGDAHRGRPDGKRLHPDGAEAAGGNLRTNGDARRDGRAQHRHSDRSHRYRRVCEMNATGKDFSPHRRRQARALDQSRRGSESQ